MLREAYGNFEGHVEGVGRYERDENVAVKIFAFGNACNQAHFSDGVGQSGQQYRGPLFFSLFPPLPTLPPPNS